MESDSSDEESDSEYSVIINQDGHVDSDNTITEETLGPDVDEVQQEGNTSIAVQSDTESHGDAHSTHTVEGEDSVSESAQTNQDSESQQEDTPEADTSQADSDDTDVPVRRSTRVKRPPAWYTSGDYDTSKSAVNVRSEWMQKVDCITNLAQSDLFAGMQNEAARTILDILKSPVTQ